MKAVPAAVATATVRRTATDVLAAVADAVYKHKCDFGNGNTRGSIGCRSWERRVQNNMHGPKLSSLNRVFVENPRT